MDQVGSFTPEQARALWQDYLTRQQLNPSVSQNYPQRREIYEPVLRIRRVVIIGTLTAPASGSGTPTTCVAAVLKINTTTQVLTPTDDRITAYNYSEGFTATDGTYAKAEFHNGVWEIYWVACESTAAWTGLVEDPTLPVEPP